MKARVLHIVPLSCQVLELLSNLQPVTGKWRFVFPSALSVARPMSENTINASLRRLGYTSNDMTGHGFRSMASTLLNEQGWHRDAIECQLAHGERDPVRAAYNYAEHLPELPIPTATFPNLFAVDGSRLEKVGRLLKVARTTTKAILPGSMEAVYDLRHGLLHELYFDPDGCAAEITMFDQVLPSIPRGALLVNDRYYAKPVIWQRLSEQGLFMVSRHNKTVKKQRIEVLSQTRTSALSVDDWLVDMGGSQSGRTPVRLRWVHIWNAQSEIILITNVLDPAVLSPSQLVALYRRRWSIERMYLAMKDVLELNHLYNCSPAAVGQQVYATAILYNTLRASQGQIADTAAIAPEMLSVDKLFPTLIDHYINATCIAFGAEGMFEQMQARNPHLRHPGIVNVDHPALRVRIRDHLLEKRSERRRQRRFCKGRARATSYNKIPGAKKLLRN